DEQSRSGDVSCGRRLSTADLRPVSAMGSRRDARPRAGPDAGPRPTRRGRRRGGNFYCGEPRGGAGPREDPQERGATWSLRGGAHALSRRPSSRGPPASFRQLSEGIARVRSWLSAPIYIPTGTNPSRELDTTRTETKRGQR